MQLRRARPHGLASRAASASADSCSHGSPTWRTSSSGTSMCSSWRSATRVEGLGIGGTDSNTERGRLLVPNTPAEPGRFVGHGRQDRVRRSPSGVRHAGRRRDGPSRHQGDVSGRADEARRPEHHLRSLSPRGPMHADERLRGCPPSLAGDPRVGQVQRYRNSGADVRHGLIVKATRLLGSGWHAARHLAGCRRRSADRRDL